MYDSDVDVEELRQKLLDEVWAGATSGLPAMILDEDEIRNASAEELRDIANGKK